ncbi:Prespore-specific transcriptional regulator RsfA [Paraliobacillus sp. PM-2]|nr:RsfA family transcriptional regulator [Paraliobacillus sp. PM-2]CQR46939.1 Prespore-specific transcriptional regulator RsfA [Paraliobacillus sp. PM-2]
MAKVRQDAWSHEDDLLLAETVLRHIREGSTQLNAFEEVGDKLNRTSAACGFRWNAEVRQRYEQAVSIAKRQRKERKRKISTQQNHLNHSFHSENKKAQQTIEKAFINHTTVSDVKPVEVQELNLNQVIQYLRTVKKEMEETDRSQKSIEKVEQERDHLHNENEKLQKEIKHLEKQLETVQADYQAFLQIMDRARKMVVFQDQEDPTTPTFRMEKNGNLEQVAR